MYECERSCPVVELVLEIGIDMMKYDYLFSFAGLYKSSLVCL